MSDTPFLGLEPFSEKDSPFFFGRDEQKRVIARCLTVSRLTVLFGESGVGKSSILQAGVVPLLRRDAEKNQQEYGEPRLAIVVFRDWYGENLLQRLLEQIRIAVAEAVTMEPTCLQTKPTSVETLQDWTKLLGGEQELGQIFLILDQFEAYFQCHPQEFGEETFANEFPQWINRSELRINCLIGIRKDALGELHRFGESILNILDNRLELVHLDRSTAQEAIVKPIGEYNLRQIVGGHFQTSRLTVLSGAKGLGKSRVLQAIADNFKGGIIFRSWRGNPVVDLVQQTEIALKILFPNLPVSEPKTSLVKSLKEWTKHIAEEDKNNQLFIILDQFEEFFKYQPPDISEGSFVAEFSQTVNDPELLSVHFLISIRDEAQDLLKHFKEHIPNIFDHLLQLKHLEKNSAIADLVVPIQEPAQQSSNAINIEPELVEEVLDQLSPLSISNLTDPILNSSLSTSKPVEIEAPFLQLVMQQIWNKELESGLHCLRLQALKDQGGVKKIVEKYLDQAIEPFSEEEAVIAQIFRHLVTSSYAKHLYSVDELSDVIGVGQIQLRGLLENLSEKRILRPVEPARPERPETQRYEIFHDVLALPIREWIQEQKLQDQIKAEQARLKAKQEQQNTIRRQRTTRAFIILVGLAGIVAFWGWQQNQTTQQLNFRNTLVNLSSTRYDAQSRFHDSAEIESLLTILPTLQQNSKSNRYSSNPDYVTTLTSSQVTLDTILHQIREQNRWQANTSTILSSSFTPDGKAFAIGSTDGSIQVWSAEGSPTLRCEDRSSKAVIRSISVSADNQYLAAALGNGIVSLWALKDCIAGQKFQHIQELQVGGEASSVNFHPRNPRLLLTGSNDGSVSLWTIENEELERKILLESSNHPVSGVQFSSGGDKFAIGFEQGEVELWNLQGELQTTLSVSKFKAHDKAITSLSFSPNGQILVTGSEDTTVKRWSLQGNSTPTGTLLAKFEQPVFGVNFLSDGKSLLSSSLDGTVRWMTLEGKTTHAFNHSGSVWSISINPQHPQLLTTTATITGNTIRLWDLGARDLPGFRASPNSPIRDVALSPNSQLRGVAWSPDGQQVATVAEGISVANLWTLKGSPIQEFKGHRGPVNDISFNTDGELIATASSDGTARLWDSQGKTLEEFKGHQGAVLAVQFSPDGKRLATASQDNTARLWDMQGNTLQEFKGHEAPVNDVSFSPDGQQIVTASSDGTARLWNRQGKTLEEFKSEGDQQPVLSVDISRDGQRVAIGSLDTIQLWNLQGRLLAELPIGGEIRSVRFSPNSQHLGIALDSGSVLLATADGELQGLVTSSNGIPARSLSFSPDSQRLIVGLGDGRVTNWTVQIISLDDQISQACDRLNNYLLLHPEVQSLFSFCLKPEAQ